MQKCILIIDNAKEYLDFLSSNLSKEGYRVITAGNGASALELVKQIPDLIILDIVLPDMNGLDIVRELKRTTTTSAIPIFVLTSKKTEADEIICLEVGSDDFIVKPVQIQRLLARVRAIFRQRTR
jgi:Response regulators consisting of a CheY-like receiver domain and a winged-helix DNA-binding domain